MPERGGHASITLCQGVGVFHCGRKSETLFLENLLLAATIAKLVGYLSKPGVLLAADELGIFR